ncbi:hypothetical protein F4803DRAFT_565161 [Xylaria telfairii]|nr:hypothetical protein F4803DRAFT_565161 [Xylaria telfairii]
MVESVNSARADFIPYDSRKDPLEGRLLYGEDTFDFAWRDIVGRSAIFYALWPFPDNYMLRHIASNFRDGSALEDLNHQDHNKQTLLHYAVKLKGVDAVELLLTMNLDPEIKHGVDMQPMHPFDWADLGPLRGRFYDHSESSLINSLSLLRRCGRDGTRPANPGAGNPFMLIRGNPYTDPSYISNFALVLDPQQRLSQQVYIVFPCLVLRDKASYSSTESTIQSLKARHNQYFTNSVLKSERTLDETYFPSLSAENLKTRIESQVVFREYPKHKKPILTVPNLWVWRFGRSILTSYSISSNNEVWDLLQEGEHFGSLMQISHTPGIQIGLIIARHISDFGSRQNKGDFPPPLDIFECSVVQILQEVDVYIDPKKRLRPEMEQEQEFMFRIADIREELVMIQEVLEQQLEIFDTMIEDFEAGDPEIKQLMDHSNPQVGEAWKTIKSTRRTIEKYQKRVRKIDGDAERVEKRIQDQLNLKRTHISINDARTSLLLGTAVIGFTVITFSLDNSDTGETMAAYTTKYVGIWFAVAEIASLVVTGLLVGICLWFLGGAESFGAIQGNRSKETGTRHRDSTSHKVKAGFVRSQISLGNGASNLLRRAPQGASSAV